MKNYVLKISFVFIVTGKDIHIENLILNQICQKRDLLQKRICFGKIAQKSVKVPEISAADAKKTMCCPLIVTK